MSDHAFPRRRLLQWSAAAAGAGLLAACDVGGNDSGGSAQDSAQGSGQGKISALFMQQAAYSEDDVKKMTADFQAANPTITVEPTFVAYDALHDKIVAAAPAGTYDVVLIDVIWPAEFSRKKIITEVAADVPAAWQTGMLGGALTTAKYADKYYGIPWILDTKRAIHRRSCRSIGRLQR
jgi:multiple sugar transport system substrate-binding protein